MTQQRGFDGHRVRPKHVIRAVLADDKPTLSELGRRGAAARQRTAATKRLGRNNRADAEKIKSQITSMDEVIGNTHTLEHLREQWKEMARFLKPFRPLSPSVQKLVRKLEGAFMDRVKELRLILIEECNERAIEANEHICPID